MSSAFRKRNRKGIFFVLSAPSGCGKTTIGEALLAQTEGLVRSISHTSRKRREQEVDGKDYCFVSEAQFREMIEEKEFFEWEKVHTNYYGTSRKMLLELEKEHDVLSIIDYRGALSLQKEFPEQTVTLFLIPPSVKILCERIRGCGDARLDEIETRLNTAKDEVRNAHHFHYIIENNSFEEALSEISSIIQAERIKRDRREDEIQSLLNDLDLGCPL